MSVLGTVKLVGYNFVPRDYAACDGQLLPISSNTALFSLLGATYGGDGRTTFGLPNLQSRVPIHTSGTHRQGTSGGAPAVNLNIGEMPEHTHPVMATENPADQDSPEGHTFGTSGRAARYAPASAGDLSDLNPDSIGHSGGGQAHENMQPSLGLQYVICINGTYPSRDGGALPDEGEEYLADVKPYGFGFAPRGWAACEGQLLPINQYQSLFALLGTTYGGDGKTSFALPDLRGRTPVGEGSGNGSTTKLGEKVGVETVTLTAQEIPSHDHQGQLVIADPSETSPGGNLTCAKGSNYGPFTDGNPDKTMDGSTIGPPTPNSQPHENMMPFLTVNYCICLQGLFPSRN